MLFWCHRLQAGENPEKEMRMGAKLPFFDQLTDLEKSFVTRVLEEKTVDPGRISKGFRVGRKLKQPIYTSLTLSEVEGKKVAKILAGLVNSDFVDLETISMEKRADFSVPTNTHFSIMMFVGKMGNTHFSNKHHDGKMGVSP